MTSFTKIFTNVFNDNASPKMKLARRFVEDTVGAMGGAIFVANGVVATGGAGILPPSPSTTAIVALVTGSYLVGAIATDIYMNNIRKDEKNGLKP